MKVIRKKDAWVASCAANSRVGVFFAVILLPLFATFLLAGCQEEILEIDNIAKVSSILAQKPGELSTNSITVKWTAFDLSSTKLGESEVIVEVYYKEGALRTLTDTATVPSVGEVLSSNKHSVALTAVDTQTTITSLQSGKYYYVVLKSINSTDESKTDTSVQVARFITYKNSYSIDTSENLTSAIGEEIKNQGNEADLNVLDTSKITDMSGVLQNRTTFNGDVSLWDVSKVTQMDWMFSRAFDFNGDLSKWQVSNVVNMSHMFNHAESFNNNISNWDVSNVTDMSAMFHDAKAFTQNLNAWTDKIVNVTNWVHDFVDTADEYIFTGSGLEQREPNWCTAKIGCKKAADPIKIDSVEYQKPGDLKLDSITIKWQADISSSYSPSDVSIEIYYKKVAMRTSAVAVVEPTTNEVLAATKYGKVLNGSDTQVTIGELNGGFYYYVVLKSINNKDPDLPVEHALDPPRKFITYNPSYAPTTVESLKSFVNLEITAQGNLADLNIIDTSAITDLTSVFRKKTNFNGDISLWDTKNVLTMNQMFNGAAAFNGEIGEWDVGSVSDMSALFLDASAFNKSLSHWDVSSVKYMGNMFQNATSFNSDIKTWTVFNVENMESMFSGASSFNQDISYWEVTRVKNMSNMFNSATAFNSDISAWEIGKYLASTDRIDMSAMFWGASSFNISLNNWDVSKVSNMAAMFYNATAFNMGLGNWSSKIGNVTSWKNASDNYIFQGSGLAGSEPAWCTATIGCKP